MSHVTLIAIANALLIATCCVAAARPNSSSADGLGPQSGIKKCYAQQEETGLVGLKLENVATANNYRLMIPPRGGKSSSRPNRGCHIEMRASPSLPFMGTIQIGTPPQTFEALFDTGTPNSWMLHSGCLVNDAPWAPAEEGQAERAKFVHLLSSSYKRVAREQAELKFADGIKLRGWWVNETVRLADGLVSSRSLAVRDQPMAMITHLRGPEARFDVQQFPSAVIGLGFPSEATSGTHNTLFESLILEEHVRELVFSFYFRADPSGSAGELKGELILGELDRSLYTGEIIWTEVTETPAWQVRVHSIRANETTVCAHGCEAILSTGTNIIAGPKNEIARLNQQLGFGRTRADHRMYAMPGLCADHPARNISLVFEIANSHFEMKADKLMMDFENREGHKVCVSALRALSLGLDSLDGPGQKWILGAPFISSFYTVFNYGELKVGLAYPTRPRTLRS